jgi:trimethylamine--corrinoid protein Co-methyltransferase
VNDETLAVNEIVAMGADGQMLDTEHTYRHFRERWYPDLLDRRIYDEWQDNGSKSLAQAAAERVTAMLEEHRAPALAPEAATAVRAIVERAERSQSA